MNIKLKKAIEYVDLNLVNEDININWINSPIRELIQKIPIKLRKKFLDICKEKYNTNFSFNFMNKIKHIKNRLLDNDQAISVIKKNNPNLKFIVRSISSFYYYNETSKTKIRISDHYPHHPLSKESDIFIFIKNRNNKYKKISKIVIK